MPADTAGFTLVVMPAVCVLFIYMLRHSAAIAG